MDAHQVGQVRFMLVGVGAGAADGVPPQGIFGDQREIALEDRSSDPTRRRRRATAAAPVGDAFAGVAPSSRASAKPDPILVADGMTRRFGGLTAVDVDHLEVQRGAITALIGPNGAGKTTFFNLLTGFDKPDTGTWTFDGDDVRRHERPHASPGTGMVRTFQLTKALPGSR